MHEVASPSFGQWLRQRRKALDLTQEELAERISCSSALIRKIEAGQRGVSKQVAEALADYFGVSPEERQAFLSFARGVSDTQSPQRLPLISYNRHTNLSEPLTPLIGRDGEMDALRKLVLHESTRLLTLTGPPGVGKTRLGIEVALELMDYFADGVFFVPLAPITAPDLVIGTVAKTVSFEGVPGKPLLESLRGYLQGKQMLLMLDNFEQVGAAAPQVVELLEACPQLRIICTSREALHVRGERQFPVPTLELPDLRHLPSVQELSNNPAVALFVERAQAVRPGFALRNDNAQDVAAICTRLHGLPLAIELAAARTKLLSPREILRLLENRLPLLVGGARDLPARQQTLRNAIGWSYDLLNEGEQTLFARLGVFVGGCTLAAVEAVCNAEGDLGIEVLEGVASLVDKSLVRQEEGVEGESRFSMLALIRDYSLECLEEGGEAENIRRLHAEYYLALAEVGDQKLRGAEQLVWLDRLEQEHDNLRVAMEWSIEHGEVALALQLGSALGQFWDMRGYFTEGRQRLADALALMEEAKHHQRESEHLESNRIKAAHAKALMAAGTLAFKQADDEVARSHYDESEALVRQLGDKELIANSLRLKAHLAYVLDEATACHLAEQSLTLFRELNDEPGIAGALTVLAYSNFEADNFTQAADLFRQSMAMYRRLGDKQGLSNAVAGLGFLAYYQGDFAAARPLYEEALSIRRKLGARGGISGSLNNVACAAVRLGDYDAARAATLENLSLNRELGSVSGTAWDLAILGAVAAGCGQAERGARILGAAKAVFPDISLGVTGTSYDHYVEMARTQLDEETFVRAWGEGRAMTTEQAVDYALERQSDD